MALLCVVAAYNEERLLADCVRSALVVSVDEVHVFDGAWRAGRDGPAFGGARKAASTDRTADVARDAGAVFHERRGLWAHQGEKRTAMFHSCGAGPGDHVFVLDADERAAGRFPDELPDQAVNVLLRSVGPNDLPGVRSNWPKGDYCPTDRPCLRVFAWRPDLSCIAPGHYIADGARIDPYDGRASRLPLVETVRVEHHANLRDEERLAWKRAYYAVDHPARRGRIAAGLRALGAGGTPDPRPRRTKMAQKKIATRRIIGRHPVTGRDVLVAAPGRPIPDWYDPSAGESRDVGAPKPQADSAAVTSGRAGGRKAAKPRAAKKRGARRKG